MRTRVFQTQGQGGLRVAAFIDFNAGGTAALRASAISADRERGKDCPSTFERYANRVSVHRYAESFIIDKMEMGQGTGTLLQCFDQVAVRDVVAEGIETDFTRLE